MSDMPPSDLMEVLMKDPVKRGLILQLLNQEKDGFEAYKRREMRQMKNVTPIKKLKRTHCESPTALQRRRALEELNRDATSESSSSDLSEVPVAVKGPKLPFDQLLKGVRAYVEVIRNNQDRSEGIKTVMKLMGATIRDQFTNDVTHVIFKDGSFTTYQKAKLMKKHLVSVLWLDAVRRNQVRVPEKSYPAFGNKVCDENVSVLCSQLQKDYEDIIKDEKRRSMSVFSGTSKISDKNRRRTMMTPQTSTSTYVTARKSSDSLFSEEDREIASIISQRMTTSPALTSDDSDCGIIDGESSKRSKNTDLLSDDSSKSSKENKKMDSFESSASMSLISRNVPVKINKKTIQVVSDVVITSNVEPERNSDESKKVLKDSTLQSTVSSLRMSLDSDRTKSGLDKQLEHTASDSSKMKRKNSKGKDKSNSIATTLGTTMSSLRLSDSSEKNHKEEAKQKENVSDSPKVTSASTPSRRNLLTPSKRASKEQLYNNVTVRKRRSMSRQKSADEDEETEEKIDKNSRKNSEISGIANISRRSSSRLSSTSESRRSLRNDVSDERSISGGSERKNKSPRRNMRKTTSALSLESENTKKMNIQNRRNQRSSSVSSSRSEPENKQKKNSKKGKKACAKKGESSDSDSESESVNKLKKNKRTTKKAESDSVSKSESESSNNERSSSKGRKRVEVQTPRKTSVAPPNDATPAKKSRTETSTVKKTRKLYNPDDIADLASPVDEDQEREEYVKQKSQKSPEEVFVNPNNLIIPLIQSKIKPKGITTDESDLTSEESDVEFRTQKNNKKKAKRKTPPKRDSSADEQRELLDLLNKKDDEARRSMRISLSQIKPKYCYSSNSSDSQSSGSLSITPVNRRSTLDFQPLSQTQQKRRLKLDPERRTSIVCTKFHRQEVVDFEKTVRDIGVFFIEDKVTNNTSHLVAGEAKRTINMLRALARGCWILNREWLLKSKEEGKWLSEEDYEVTEFSPAVQECRLQKQAFGPKYTMDVFKEVGFIYLARNTTPRPADLKELIVTCKGRITTVYRNAAVVVGELISGENVHCVTETWVLDCITFNKVKPFKNYQIKPMTVVSPEV